MPFFSDIGGLYGTLAIVGYIFDFFYSSHAQRFFIFENLFRVSDQSRSRKEKSPNDRNARKQWWDSLRYVHLTSCEKFLQAMFCCSPRRTRKLLNKSQDKMDRYLDVHRQMRAAQLTESALKYLLSPKVLQFVRLQRKDRVLDSSDEDKKRNSNDSTSDSDFLDMYNYSDFESYMAIVSKKKVNYSEADLLRGVFQEGRLTKTKVE